MAATSTPLPPKKKTRDSDCCSVNFLKYVLHVYNVIFLLAGIAVLAVGVWTITSKHQFVALLATATYELTAYVLLAAGALVLLTMVVGCIAVYQENRCLLLVYTFALLLIFLLEAMVGILAYVYEGQVDSELRLSLNSTFLENYKFEDDATLAIDRLQREYKCCGAIRFEDWRYSRWLKENSSSLKGQLVPDSCCKTESERCGKSDHPSNIHYNGCIYRLATELQDHLNILGAIGLGLCVVQVFGMVFACSLYIKLKDVIEP